MLCETAGRSAAKIPWDNGHAFFRTAWAATRSPKTFFGRFPLSKAPSLVGPLVFALVATLPWDAFMFAVYLHGSRRDPPRLAINRVIIPILMLASGPMFAITTGVVFGACIVLLARASGRRLPLRTGIRAGFYMEAAWLFVAPFMLLSVLVNIPPHPSPVMQIASGWTTVAAFLALFVHEINCLRWFARRSGASSRASWMYALASSVMRGVGAATIFLAMVTFTVLLALTIQAL